ncbi:MAG TPA: GatB/YqeY domain-containing protein [bacterium]|nr:GatB/YqeY domain-containing protein [bacterium]HEX68441.1 GatB/YqeY domain-containing protein [bacterium]
MSLKEKILEDLKFSLKNKEDLKVSVLRFLLSAIKNKEKELKKETLEDGEVMEIIRKQVKQREEAIELYKKGGRKELVEKETREKEILLSYLPQQIQGKELEELVEKIIKEMGVTSRKEMGKVMGKLMNEYRGRVDGKEAYQKVMEILTKIEGGEE